MEHTTKADLLAFLDMLVTKGWINGNTGASWKAAVSKILADVDTTTDVRKIDVKTELLRFNNLHPGQLSPASLKVYEQRVQLAIANFISYKSDPTAYRPPSRMLNGKSDKQDAKGQAARGKRPLVKAVPAPTPATTGEAPRHEFEPAKPVVGTATESNLALPFPLRPNYLAQIVIPRDLTKDEADRLCAFIQALAQK